MRATLAALIAVSLVAGWPGDVDAAKAKRKLESRVTMTKSHRAKVPSRVEPRPFDENEYYERLLEKIPFGTAAWWRQMQIEFATQD